MSENMYRSLCNVGVSLTCESRSGHCLCPNQNSYQMICFRFYKILKESAEEMKGYNELYNDAISLVNRLGMNKVQILDKTVGRLYIRPEEFHMEFCADEKSVVKIAAPVRDDDIKLFKKLKSGHQVALISLTALANTQMAILGHGEDINFIDMLSICRAELFMEYFWNLTYNVMDSIHSGKNCEIWGQRLGRYLQGITRLYQNRTSLGDVFLNYRDLICKGLERHNIRWRDFDIVYASINKFAIQKKQTQSFDDFIFASQDDKDMLMGYFKRILLALKDYLKSYIDGVSSQETFVNDLRRELDAFILNCEVDLLSTDHLEGILQNSKRTYKANADMIIRYLRKVGRSRVIKQYEAA